MSYTRVIPRDLFNESKLLKCLGQLALLIHDGVGIPNGLKLEYSHFENDDGRLEEGFRIEQDESDGALYCSNLELFCDGRLIGLRCPYNSKDPYPLIWTSDEDEGMVFCHDGSLTKGFKRRALISRT